MCEAELLSLKSMTGARRQSGWLGQWSGKVDSKLGGKVKWSVRTGSFSFKSFVTACWWAREVNGRYLLVTEPAIKAYDATPFTRTSGP